MPTRVQGLPNAALGARDVLWQPVTLCRGQHASVVLPGTERGLPPFTLAPSCSRLLQATGGSSSGAEPRGATQEEAAGLDAWAWGGRGRSGEMPAGTPSPWQQREAPHPLRVPGIMSGRLADILQVPLSLTRYNYF